MLHDGFVVQRSFFLHFTECGQDFCLLKQGITVENQINSLVLFVSLFCCFSTTVSGAANAIPLKPSGQNNWYASTNISSDSDSDGEGYVEPYTDPTFVEQKTLWKVLSDGAINRVGRIYDDKESATHLYHHLDKNTYHSGFSNDSEPASYVDLIPS